MGFRPHQARGAAAPRRGAAAAASGRADRRARRPSSAAAGEPLYAATEARLGGTRPWRRFEALLERAGCARRTAELVWLGVAAFLVVALLFSTSAGPVAGALLAALLVLGGGLGWLRIAPAGVLAAFDEQLPEVLRDVAGSLRAGHSLSQALQSVAADAPSPAKEELGRALAETALGRPLEEALEEMTGRLPSEELRYVLTAITVQRQVGGSLASLFDLVTETVYQRQRFERKVRALTASGRLAAVVLLVLPFGLALLLELLNPSYLAPLAHGIAALVVLGLVMMTIGGLVLKRIVSVKVAA